MKEQEKAGNKEEIIYKLQKSWVQTIAVESIGREMSDEELDEFEDVFGESIYEHVYYCIRTAKDMVLWRSNLR